MYRRNRLTFTGLYTFNSGYVTIGGSNKFKPLKPLNRQENVMNMKNILSATLLVAGLFTAQTAAAEVRFFQDAGRADGKVAMSLC